MNKLLLIVDVQNQFVPEGEEGTLFCRKIENLQRDYKYVAASQFINYPDSFWVKYLQWDEMMEGEESTKLAFEPEDNVFIYKSKTFTSYSEPLINYIKKNRISEVHICGVDTDACIMATAYDLWDAHIEFRILIDYCISAAGNNIESSAKHIMNKNFGFEIVTTTQDLNKKNKH